MNKLSRTTAALALVISTSALLPLPATAQDDHSAGGIPAPDLQQPLPTRGAAKAADAGYLALGAEMLRLNDRIAALERLIAQLVARQDEDHHDVGQITNEYARFRADIEARVSELATQTPVVVAEAAAALPAPASAAAPAPPTSIDRFEQAMAFARKQDWPGAELAFSTFIANNPDDPRIAEARYQLGLAYLGQGQAGQAAGIFLNLFETGVAAGFGADNLFALATALRALDDIDPAQICSVYSEIEVSYGASLSTRQREELLDLRLAADCGKK